MLHAVVGAAAYYDIRAVPDPEVEEAWLIKAERRWKEIESGEVKTIPWEEVREKLFRGE